MNTKKKSLKEQAIDHIMDKISMRTQLVFDNDGFTFYEDSCGQREHIVIPYMGYNEKKPIRGMFKVIRKLSFVNEIDKGKDGAILGVVDLAGLDLISLSEKKVVFKMITFLLN